MVLPDKLGTVRWTLVRLLYEGVQARVFIDLPEDLKPVDNDKSLGALFTLTLDGGGFCWSPSKYLKPVGAGTANGMRGLLVGSPIGGLLS